MDLGVGVGVGVGAEMDACVGMDVFEDIVRYVL